MLYLIGLGMEEKDISLKGIEACRSCDEIFAELYTSIWNGSLKNLERLIGKKITELGRSGVEEESSRLVAKAAKNDVALLVVGDPLTATTHLHLLMEAREKGVEYGIIHAPSILTAIAETGLQLYKFGMVITIPKPQKGYSPTSFYDHALMNAKSGFHTLFLLDITMDTGEAIKLLLDAEKEKKKHLLSAKTELISASSLGTADSKILYGTAEELMGKPMGPPAVVILPGKMHFLEEEFLDTLKSSAK